MNVNKIHWVEPYTRSRYLLKKDVVVWLKEKGLNKEATELENSDGENNAPINLLHPHCKCGEKDKICPVHDKSSKSNDKRNIKIP